MKTLEYHDLPDDVNALKVCDQSWTTPAIEIDRLQTSVSLRTGNHYWLANRRLRWSSHHLDWIQSEQP